MKYLLALLVFAAAPASAEVVSASSNGFEVRETVPLVVPPAADKGMGDKAPADKPTTESAATAP